MQRLTRKEAIERIVEESLLPHLADDERRWHVESALLGLGYCFFSYLEDGEEWPEMEEDRAELQQEYGEDLPLVEKLCREMHREEDLKSDLGPECDGIVRKYLSSGWRGVSNEYLVSRLTELGYEHVDLSDEPAMLARCPCCGYRTLEQRGDYECCPVCFWEDSGADDPNDGVLGPNHITLSEARKNFERIGVSQEVFLQKERHPHVDPDRAKKYLR